jgi:hypothetical protein
VDPPAESVCLTPSVLNDLELRIATPQLIDPGDDDVELDSQLLEDLPPLRGPGCERYLQGSSGNQIAISRSADSSESEPWTMLKVTSSA